MKPLRLHSQEIIIIITIIISIIIIMEQEQKNWNKNNCQSGTEEELKGFGQQSQVTFRVKFSSMPESTQTSQAHLSYVNRNAFSPFAIL